MRVELATPAGHRRRLVAGAVACGAVAAGVVAIVVAGVGGGSSWVGRISLLIVIAALVGLVVMLGRAARAPEGWVEIDEDRLTLVHPELLRAPVIAPRSAVRTLLIDGSSGAAEGLAGSPELAPRFPLVEADGDPAWLHPGARSALPFLGWQRSVPDAALVLRGPLELGGAPRRLLAFFEGNEELRALATCAGFFLQLADPQQAAAALAGAGLDPPLTLAEAERLDDFAEDRRFGRRGDAPAG